MTLTDVLEGVRLFLRRRPRSLVVATVAAAVLVWGVAAWAAWFTWDVTMGLPTRGEMGGIGDMAQSTTIYDVKGRQVFTIFKEQRIEVPLGRVSPLLVKAVIAIEDQRFYEHRGVDFVRVAGSLLANLREGRAAQGGSTITQQLARLSFLSRDKTIRRKLKEVLLAAQLEHSYTKQEILELYLNKVYLGDGLHGVEAAALGYFGRHAADLDLEQAALVAGLIQSPSAYAPTSRPDRALTRRNLVLRAMLDNGAIQKDGYDRARATKVELTDGLRRDEEFGLYFKEQVRRELVDRFGWDRVSVGGLRVYTTIDADVQHQAERVVEEGLKKIEARSAFKYPPREKLEAAGTAASDYLQAAVVVLDVATGEVRALVGGRSFNESRFNRAVQAKRQPGSAFKPFVYATALENGFTPATVLTNLDDPILTPQGEWMPEDEHSAADSMTLRTALRTSSNRAAVALLREVGIDKTLSYVTKLNVGTVPGVMSLALGAGEVTLLNMTAAYGAFASGGWVRQPVFIRRVEDAEGAVLAEAKVDEHQAVSETTAYLLANMLADVVNSGTGYRARTSGFLLPAAGKTGTTNDYHDAWFVGFTPKTVAGVWIGFDQPRTIIANGYAGELAVPLWADVMKAATRGDKAEWLKKPEGVVGVEVCRVSGKLPADGCREVQVMDDAGNTSVKSMVYWEYFPRGKEPTDVCDLHPKASFFDRLAGAFGKDVGPGPVPAESVGLPPTVPGGVPAPAEPGAEGDERAEVQAAPAEPVKKKRGFWARVFGVGKDQDDGGKDEPDRKKKKDGKKPPP